MGSGEARIFEINNTLLNNTGRITDNVKKKKNGKKRKEKKKYLKWNFIPNKKKSKINAS